jgi:REP element-mobilizing transposase RayT
MPRQARIDAPGALHHIIARGIEKKLIFRDDPDRDSFVERLSTILKDSETPCYAWALMPNHAHLLLKTAGVPIAILMRRLFTGHAISFNKRHRRNGYLFQNRYKSILCEEDKYLLELVRYIHLNPLRGHIVSDLKELGKYPYCGHSAVIGKYERDWQHTDYVLGLFGKRKSPARKNYLEFIEKGIPLGKRPELTGGGLVRSAGGWIALKALRGSKYRMVSDERILGDGDFVEAVLKEANEQLERKYRLVVEGFNIDKVAQRVAGVLDLPVEYVWEKSRRPQVVRARDLFCFWVSTELGISATDIAKKLELTQPAVSMAIRRGESLARKYRLELLDR